MNASSVANYTCPVLHPAFPNSSIAVAAFQRPCVCLLGWYQTPHCHVTEHLCKLSSHLLEALGTFQLASVTTGSGVGIFRPDTQNSRPPGTATSTFYVRTFKVTLRQAGSLLASSPLACERRRISSQSSCHCGDKRQPEIRLRSQTTSP